MHSLQLLLVASMLNIGTFKLMKESIQTTNRFLSLFDDEKMSPLYCHQSLSSLITNGPRHHLRIPNNGTPMAVNCIPGRYDLASPVRYDESLAPAFCALTKVSDGEEPAVSLLKVKLCDSH